MRYFEALPVSAPLMFGALTGHVSVPLHLAVVEKMKESEKKVMVVVVANERYRPRQAIPVGTSPIMCSVVTEETRRESVSGSKG